MTDFKKLVVFDMDGTLISGNTWFDFNRAMGVTDDQDYALYKSFVNDEITYEQWLAQLLEIYNLAGNKHTKQQVLDYLTQYQLMPEALECLQAIHTAGHDTLLLTGSFQMTADAVAFELDIPTALATTNCIFDTNGHFVHLESKGDEQFAKLTSLINFCDERGISLTDCIVLGDGPNDIELFKAVRNSVTFTHAPESAKAAATYTIESLGELPALITQMN